MKTFAFISHPHNLKGLRALSCLLTLSRKPGQEINVDKIEEIADIGAKYGFEAWVPPVSAL